MSASVIRRLVFVLLLSVIAAGLVRASLDGFDAKRRAIVTACQEERKRLGISNDDLPSKYPTPEISLVTTACIPVGGTGQLIVKGKFLPGTKFLLHSDQLEVVKESVTATEYRATIKAPAGLGPEVADISAYSPVSCASAHAQKAAVVSGKWEWDLQSSNGWRIKARPGVDTRCNSRGQGALQYTVEFYRGAETTPFQKRPGELFFSPWDQHPYQLRVEEEKPGGDFQAQMQAISQKLMNPNTSMAEREKAMAEMQELQKKVMAKMSDMAAVQNEQKQFEQKKKEFGCEVLELQIGAGSQVQGLMRCGELVGRRIQVNGTVKVLPIS